MYEYPNSDLDNGRKLLGLLGSFWADLYDGRSFVGVVGRARGEVEQQNYLNLMEAICAFSRYEVPIFHRQNWHLLVILQSEKGKYIPRYGDAGLIYNQGDLVYGEPLTLANLPTWTLPDGLVALPAIFNRLADPSVALTVGTEFSIDLDRRLLVFLKDPFDNPLFATRPVFDEAGNQTDTELFLWLFKGDFDWKYVYNHWGYVLGTTLESSEAYRDLLNAVFDALAGGTGFREIRMAYAAMTGLPLVKEVSEIVETVIEDATSQLVITDQHVYHLPLESELTVAVGDELTAGDTLTAGLQFAELNRGDLPEWVRAFGCGPGLLVGKYFSELVFENKSYPVTVTSDDAGITRIEFPVGGFPLDVEAFWNTVHTSGVAKGQTLADLLDTRTNKVGQPGPSNLPDEINPAEFLAENVFRHNVVLVRVRTAEIAAGAIGLSPARLLRKIVPPGTTLIVMVEVSPPADSVILDAEPTSSTAGGMSTIGAFDGANTVSETVAPSLTGYVRPPQVSAKAVSGTCQ